MKRILITFSILIIFILFFTWDTVIDILPIDQSGWRTNEYGKYYRDKKGDPVSGWCEIEGTSYYFSPDTQILHTGWVNRDDETCYVQNGVPANGWLDLEEGHYYLTDGIMYTGWLNIDNKQLYMQANGTLASGWAETPDGRMFFDTTGAPFNGIAETESGRYCFRQGLPYSGWLEENGKRYYFHQDGSMHTGWLEEGGKSYYLQKNGAAAVGKLLIDGNPYFFSSTGENFILVNPWNSLPEDYTTELVLVGGVYVSADCQTALENMLTAGRAAGHYLVMMSGYRRIEDQTALFNDMLNQKLRTSYDYASAYQEAAKIIAVPGTSEHHLGLAVDIADIKRTELNAYQETLPGQQWLMENCWDYGFILRYPNGTTEHTGIIYEPWHYRYVGVEIAQELRELDICLEEYVNMLTEDGSRCNSGPPAKNESFNP